MLVFLRRSRLVSSELVTAEVPRASRRIAATNPGANLTAGWARAEILMEEMSLYAIDGPVLRRAASLADPHLRSLDAIHVATALGLRPIERFLTYDKRQAAAARAAGLPVASPGA